MFMENPMTDDTTLEITDRDEFIVVDVQKDFLPGGSLAVADGDAVVPVLNRCIKEFDFAGRPVFATRDWHPAGHCSFVEQGGSWPPHCVADTEGAAFAPKLKLNKAAIVIDKATTVEKDAYSGFEGTDLEMRLKDLNVDRVYVGGLATDYCVLQTVKDALAREFSVVLLTNAIRAVNIAPNDGDRAIRDMTESGAKPHAYAGTDL